MRHTRHIGRGCTLRGAWIMAFAGAVALLVAAPAARAGYVQLTQTRSLDTGASASFGTTADDADSDHSEALGSFDQSITSTASNGDFLPPNFYGGSGTGVARQSAQLTPTSISGSFIGDAQATTTSAASSSRANSTWSTTFRADQPTPFDLDGRMSAQDVSVVGFTGGNAAGSLTLSRHADAGGPEVVLYSVALPPFPGGIPPTVDFSGVLEPGYVYSLAATAMASRENQSLGHPRAVYGQTITTVTFTLTAVPEPAAAGVLALVAALALRRRRA